MFFRTISYIKFLFSSTNQHGVHSPFVYSFVTKGLYKKNTEIINFDEYSQLKNLSKKKVKILSKIVNYFKIDEIKFDFKKSTNTLDKDFKLLYLSELKIFKSIKTNNHNSNEIILIDNIHQNKKSFEEWQKIIQNKEISVTIDLYHFGLIFFRKKQAKEHFKVRV